MKVIESASHDAPLSYDPRSFAASATSASRQLDGDRYAAARQLLELARRRRRAELIQARGRLWALKATLLAPLRAVRNASRAVSALGQATKDDCGVSIPRQFASMWWLNLRYFYHAETVYRFRLFSRDRVLPMPLFAEWNDAAFLFRLVSRRAASGAAETLADKRRFAAWCAEHGLPTPPILMEFERGEVTRDAVGSGGPPRTDLFAKWGTQYGGGDTRRWRYEDGRYRDTDGRAWEFDEIVSSLVERSREGVVLLQPRLFNHPAIRRLSPNALSTIRVMTTRRPGEEPRFLAGVLRMGTGNSTADNFAQGGIASAVDALTGVAGPARRLDELHRTHVHETHPDTHERIAGFRVPLWREAVDLALDAHAKLGPIACVGWDVAVLEDGPVLLEGNWNPCTKLLQVATQVPLYATEIADTYLTWLARPECTFGDVALVTEGTWTPV